MTYEIQGNDMPVVVCRLNAGESMITERGSMAWMSPNLNMKTISGGLGKALGRLLSSESLFRNIYTAENGPGMIAFASSFPGSILALEVTPEKPIIAQKSAFLASTEGVELSVFLQKKIGAAVFGGEGFIMQKISGRGIVFLEIDGSAITYDLVQGQQLIVDTGNLAMVEGTCSIDIQQVKGVKNVLFGGEGLFNTIVTGPGKVTLQTMPMSNLIGTIAAHLPSSNK